MVTAIQTSYNGYHFRSRLEARWACLFDQAGIIYDYEPQGLMVTKRLELDDHPTRPYLPDFWFPELGMWGEVKGDLTPAEEWQVYNDAASLSSNDGGGCHDAGGNDLVLLGPIPHPIKADRLPMRLHFHKGTLYGQSWNPYFSEPCYTADAIEVANDSGAHTRSWPITHSAGYDWVHRFNLAAAADSARRARFEHGETPR